MSEVSPVIVALDFPNSRSVNSFLDKLHDRSCNLKVGLELFIAEGPNFVEKLVHNGHRVFLDLKLHDIPNTVASACRVAAELGVWMMTLHASGGKAMLLAAHDAVKNVRHRPKIIAVTLLTSLDEQYLVSIGIKKSSKEYVQNLTSTALQANLDGIVCSVHEAKAIRDESDDQTLIITPGIRLLGTEKQDQSRVASPHEARLCGANYIVVGRPITQAVDPVLALDQYLADWGSS